MYDYEEACPVSKASSVLCERWTLQIIREMFFGASRFSDFQKFLPRVSPTLLNARLKRLEQEGIILRRRIAEKKGYEYQLTPCGQALRPVLYEMGKWGMMWVVDQLTADEMNLLTLIRDFAVALQLDQFPTGDATIQFNVTLGNKREQHFIQVRDGATSTCQDNAGYDVDVYLNCSLETLGNLWYGRISVADALTQEKLQVTGHRAYTKNLSRWLGLSQFSNCDSLRHCRR